MTTPIDLAPYYSALNQAHQAGDTNAANQFANYIKAQTANQQAGADYAKSGFSGKEVGEQGKVERFLGGAKHAWDRAALGLKGAFTDLTPEDKQLLEGGKQYVKGGGTAATVGEIAGDVGIYSSPILRGSQAIRGGARIAEAAAPIASPVTRVLGSRGASLAPDIISSAATSAALAPEDRMQAAQGGAIGGALGNVAGKAISSAGGLLRGKVTPEAQALMNQGIDVPAWKATSSNAVRSMFEAGKGLPLVKQAIQAEELRAFQGMNKLLSKESTPPTLIKNADGTSSWKAEPLQNQVGPKAVSELSERFDKAYKEVYGNQKITPDEMFVNEINKITKETGDYFPAISSEFNGTLKQVGDILTAGSKESGATGQYAQFGRPATPDAVQQALRTIDERINGAWRRGNAELAEQLENLRGSIADLRSRNVPEANKEAMAQINKAYTSFKPYQRASGSLGAAKQEYVSPQQMANALRAGDKSPDKAAFARGNLPNQERVMQAQRVLGSELPEVGPGTAEKLLTARTLTGLGSLGYGGYNAEDLAGAGGVAGGIGLGLLATTPAGQKFLLGQYKAQKPFSALADAEKSSAMARALLTTGQNKKEEER